MSVAGDARYDSITEIYYKDGHRGPLWEVCVNSKSDVNIKCPIVLPRLMGIFY
jgi:hypothetical protein